MGGSLSFLQPQLSIQRLINPFAPIPTAAEGGQPYAFLAPQLTGERLVNPFAVETPDRPLPPSPTSSTMLTIEDLNARRRAIAAQTALDTEDEDTIADNLTILG